jgi:hypothetical protein
MTSHNQMGRDRKAAQRRSPMLDDQLTLWGANELAQHEVQKWLRTPVDIYPLFFTEAKEFWMVVDGQTCCPGEQPRDLPGQIVADDSNGESKGGDSDG